MRVLLTTSTFPVRLGNGLPRFVYDLAAALADPCQLRALAPDAPGAPRVERMGPVEVRRFATSCRDGGSGSRTDTTGRDGRGHVGAIARVAPS